jgi:hypothetical protein
MYNNPFTLLSLALFSSPQLLFPRSVRKNSEKNTDKSSNSKPYIAEQTLANALRLGSLMMVPNNEQA